MSDTRVTPPAARATSQHRKIRISGSDGTYHTNPPEILAQRGSQRAARANLPTSMPTPHRMTPRTGEAPTMPPKALYKVSEAMAILSLSRSVIYELMRAGRLRSVHEGRTRLIPASAIARYVSLLEDEAA